jgi:hypothetical protein
VTDELTFHTKKVESHVHVPCGRELTAEGNLGRQYDLKKDINPCQQRATYLVTTDKHDISIYTCNAHYERSKELLRGLRELDTLEQEFNDEQRYKAFLQHNADLFEELRPLKKMGVIS